MRALHCTHIYILTTKDTERRKDTITQLTKYTRNNSKLTEVTTSVEAATMVGRRRVGGRSVPTSADGVRSLRRVGRNRCRPERACSRHTIRRPHRSRRSLDRACRRRLTLLYRTPVTYYYYYYYNIVREKYNHIYTQLGYRLVRLDEFRVKHGL